MKASLKQRTFNHLRNRPGQWIAGGELERLAMTIGYTGSTASRRFRELCEAGMVEKMEVNGHTWYRFRAEETQKEPLKVEVTQGSLTI